MTPEAQAISGISLNIGGILISLRDVMLKEARMHARLERKRTLRGAKIAKGWAKARIELEKAKKRKPTARKTGPGIYDFD